MEYLYYKLIHLLSVVIFLGNIITGIFWMNIAVKTKDLKIIHHTIRGLIKSDKYFTIPGVIIITVGGFMAEIDAHFPILSTGWILWPIILFSISGFIFTFKVAPLQNKLYHFTEKRMDITDFDWINFQKSYLKWKVWGIIAILTPIIAFVMMTLKIPK